jgi:hypothetical protein
MLMPMSIFKVFGRFSKVTLKIVKISLQKTIIWIHFFGNGKQK